MNEGLIISTITKSVLILANSVDPDETPPIAASYGSTLFVYVPFFACIQPFPQVWSLNLRLATPLPSLAGNIKVANIYSAVAVCCIKLPTSQSHIHFNKQSTNVDPDQTALSGAV